jgi:beta-lactamase class A
VLATALCFLGLGVLPTAHAKPGPGAAPGADSVLSSLLVQKLKDAVAAVERSVDGVLGVVLVDLQTGQHLGWNQDAVFPVASAIKVPILLELLRQSQLAAAGTPGLARLDDPYTPRPEDVIADSNILAGLSFGTTRLTNRDLATFMVVVSDNGATNVLIDRVGMPRVNELLVRLGLGRTRLRRKMLDAEAVRRDQENTSTPAELAELWERLYRGQLLDAAHTSEALRVLSLHKADYLSTLLPPEVRVASKPGSLDGARTDAGVIWAGQKHERPFLVSAMVAYAHDDRAAEAAIAQVAAAAYSCFARLADSTSYGRRLP